MSQIRSNAKNTCRNFKHLLGRKLDSKDVEVEKFWSTCNLETADDGFAGYDVNYKGEQRVLSATQVTAMYLTKLVDATEKWCQAKVADAVITVPSSFSDEQRQAVLDAAKIANLPVLRIMNEHTATALAYGIYRSNDFDAEKPMTVAFASMGHSIFSVSIVQFVKGKLSIVGEKSDKVGGRDMDECLMRVFADQFKKKIGCDPLSNKKAMYKLEDAVTKTKKILSANSEAGLNVECLMEDEDFSSNMTRADFESMCKPMMDRVQAVLDGAKAAAGDTAAQIDSVEVVGGGSRVPWVKRMISEAFGGKELATTMNQEESVARGAALQAAILSPLYKVRDFTVEDSSPNGIAVKWMGSAADSEAAKDDDGDTQMGGCEGEQKTTTLFPANSMMNTLKVLTFYRKGPFDVKAEFINEGLLPEGTTKELGNFRVELAPQTETKKVKVRAKLTLHGTFSIEGAQLLEEEEYDEKTKEKRELPPDPVEAQAPAADGAAPEAPAADGTAEGAAAPEAAPAAANGAAAPEADAEGAAKETKPEPPPPKAPEKKYEWVEVVKKKKRTKATDLPITRTGAPGLPAVTIQKHTDEESAMIAEMNDIVETDERRNDLESYIFSMRDKIAEGGEYGEYISAADRTKFTADLTKAEDWLYDTMDATKAMYCDKLNEQKSVGDAVVWRFKEASMKGEWVSALEGTARNYRAAAENPGEKYGHIAADKLAKISTACAELEKWLGEMLAKQASLPKTERPVLICADMEKKNHELAKMADEILKEPKPAPPKEENKEEAKPGEATAAPPADGAAPAEGTSPDVADVD